MKTKKTTKLSIKICAALSFLMAVISAANLAGIYISIWQDGDPISNCLSDDNQLSLEEQTDCVHRKSSTQAIFNEGRMTRLALAFTACPMFIILGLLALNKQS